MNTALSVISLPHGEKNSKAKRTIYVSRGLVVQDTSKCKVRESLRRIVSGVLFYLTPLGPELMGIVSAQGLDKEQTGMRYR